MPMSLMQNGSRRWSDRVSPPHPGISLIPALFFAGRGRDSRRALREPEHWSGSVTPGEVLGLLRVDFVIHY